VGGQKQLYLLMLQLGHYFPACYLVSPWALHSNQTDLVKTHLVKVVMNMISVGAIPPDVRGYCLRHRSLAQGWLKEYPCFLRQVSKRRLVSALQGPGPVTSATGLATAPKEIPGYRFCWTSPQVDHPFPSKLFRMQKQTVSAFKMMRVQPIYNEKK
jgi:hypothetical protein